MTADELRSWMDARGYSVRALARLLSVAPSTVQTWRSAGVSRMGELLLRELPE